MKKVIAIIILLFVSQISIAQLDTKTKNKVRAKFEVAKQSYINSDYSNTLVKIEEIETLLNGNNLPSLLNLKIKALVGNKQFIVAEKELEKLYEYDLTSDITKDIANYEPIITKKVKEEQNRISKLNAPTFEFVSKEINYGAIPYSSNGLRTFEFKNVGKNPLIITEIKSSCDCTIPKKPEKPILSGETGIIEVKYDTSKPGGFSKRITVYSNSIESEIVLRIKGIVLKKD